MKHQNTIIAITAIGALLLGAPAAQAVSGETKYQRWQMDRLLSPSDKQLAQESKGKVFIYDGLRDKDVSRVMKEQFDRVETMMFIGTIVTDDNGKPKKDPETGTIVTEDDGC